MGLAFASLACAMEDGTGWHALSGVLMALCNWVRPLMVILLPMTLLLLILRKTAALHRGVSARRGRGDRDHRSGDEKPIRPLHLSGADHGREHADGQQRRRRRQL